MAGIGRTRAGRRSRFACAWRGSMNSLRATRHDAGARSPSSPAPDLPPGGAPASRAARQPRLLKVFTYQDARRILLCMGLFLKKWTPTRSWELGARASGAVAQSVSLFPAG